MGWWFVFVGFVVCVLFGLVVRLVCGWLYCVYVVCVGVACCLVELLVDIGYVDTVFCLVLWFVRGCFDLLFCMVWLAGFVVLVVVGADNLVSGLFILMVAWLLAGTGA